MLKNHNTKKCKWDRIQKDREVNSAEQSRRELEKITQEFRKMVY